MGGYWSSWKLECYLVSTISFFLKLISEFKISIETTLPFQQWDEKAILFWVVSGAGLAETITNSVHAEVRAETEFGNIT